jgi:hypothetical protein
MQRLRTKLLLASDKTCPVNAAGAWSPFVIGRVVVPAVRGQHVFGG